MFIYFQTWQLRDKVWISSKENRPLSGAAQTLQLATLMALMYWEGSGRLLGWLPGGENDVPGSGEAGERTCAVLGQVLVFVLFLLPEGTAARSLTRSRLSPARHAPGGKRWPRTLVASWCKSPGSFACAVPSTQNPQTHVPPALCVIPDPVLLRQRKRGLQSQRGLRDLKLREGICGNTDPRMKGEPVVLLHP